MIEVNNRHSRMALLTATNLFESLPCRCTSLYYGKIIPRRRSLSHYSPNFEVQVLQHLFPKMTRSGFIANDILANYKGKKKVEGSLPEAKDKATLKRKRSDQDMDGENETPLEEVLVNQATMVARMMAKEIKEWRDKADTLEMDRAEYEKDLRDAFKILREKRLEVKAKDEEISRWVARLANVGKRHAKEMEMRHDDMMNETEKSVFEARIQMIKEYRAGEHVNWNLEEENAALQRILDEKMGEVTSKKVEQVEDAQDSNTE